MFRSMRPSGVQRYVSQLVSVSIPTIECKCVPRGDLMSTQR
jgi:hypothetical protein